jgi:hypothetical protein
MEIIRNRTETAAGPEEWLTGAAFLDSKAKPSEGSRLDASSVHAAPSIEI